MARWWCHSRTTHWIGCINLCFFVRAYKFVRQQLLDLVVWCWWRCRLSAAVSAGWSMLNTGKTTAAAGTSTQRIIYQGNFFDFEELSCVYKFPLCRAVNRYIHIREHKWTTITSENTSEHRPAPDRIVIGCLAALAAGVAPSFSSILPLLGFCSYLAFTFFRQWRSLVMNESVDKHTHTEMETKYKQRADRHMQTLRHLENRVNRTLVFTLKSISWTH